ncbi:MAG: Tn3 family transposase [Candidatus Competibacteraceae bacterium]|jgi:TnpA family transposase|nr:Tn3 family transposase [Candidatus Competibacteraceae bacterium]MCB1803583.1 Tn3 family transposase [Candidatus Competibacteraceae bacterium]MCB1810238.1 Tn3 family transposase [Candidatus Competibacteraceae bacterium]
MTKEQFLSKRQRYQPITLPQHFSDEEMVRDWTLSVGDIEEVAKYRKSFRLFVAIQLCAVRLYGRFLNQIHDLSPHIINYLGQQLDLPPSLGVEVPQRKATYTDHRQNIMAYLGFQRFDDPAQQQLETWIEQQARLGTLPHDLFAQAEHYLFDKRVLLPGPSVLERLIIRVCSEVHLQLFKTVFRQLSPELRQAIDRLLMVPDGEQRSYFYHLKAYPPTASISSIQAYLKRYQTVAETGIDAFEHQLLTPEFLDYLFKQAKRYSAKDLKRFADHKRYALMLCFLLETRKILLDHLVAMHDQYIVDIARQVRNAYEKKHRALRQRQKRAIDVMLDLTDVFLAWPDDQPLSKKALWRQVEKGKVHSSRQDLQEYKRLEERGYGDLLLHRYPSLRKYFADFIQLPFAAKPGSEPLLRAIELVRQLDTGTLTKLPLTTPIMFVPKELRRALRDPHGHTNRNAWEMGLALAMKEALRSGDLYLPQSKQHVSFWELMLSKTRWQAIRTSAFDDLKQPPKHEIKAVLNQQFNHASKQAQQRFPGDGFAAIKDGKLQLKRYDKIALPPVVTTLQKVINARLPLIRIEQLLMEVDQLTGFCCHFTPLQAHQSRPPHFYKTLLAALISQATNLGVVSMSASVKDTTVDRLRHVLHDYVREETLTAASAEIVNQHHALPFSTVHGTGTLSSSDAQRFGIRASSLLASYYPRYYGYYKKAIGVYTHVSDQYSVFSTKVISCNPREALYVLDGLLENNTILKIREHTTDTHGYTEIIFALCHLLGFYFMPRIRDLKDQQLYRVDRLGDYGVFTPLLTKTADLNIIEEQWEEMIRVALSLKQRTAPAHVVVQRLTSSFPLDRLSKAFTNLGRIIKTQYILRYLTDLELRQTVQLQLNKGEYRHKLPRRIFFADQGEFTTGDYEEIMNKASCLSLVSNAILYWNTIKINEIVENLRSQGANIDQETLSHISLLPYRHVVPNGTYFIEDR